MRDRFARILVADLNLDGYQDMVVSARGVKVDKTREQGEVFVPMARGRSCRHPRLRHTRAAAIGIVEDVYHRNNSGGLTPTVTNSGFSIALGDPNQDGYPDLIVGSPYSLVADHVNQNGEAYIYWGAVVLRLAGAGAAMGRSTVPAGQLSLHRGSALGTGCGVRQRGGLGAGIQ
ncbi:MAG: integrin alpha [Planctomycetota bacterium]